MRIGRTASAGTSPESPQEGAAAALEATHPVDTCSSAFAPGLHRLPSTRLEVSAELQGRPRSTQGPAVHTQPLLEAGTIFVWSAAAALHQGTRLPYPTPPSPTPPAPQRRRQRRRHPPGGSPCGKGVAHGAATHPRVPTPTPYYSPRSSRTGGADHGFDGLDANRPSSVTGTAHQVQDGGSAGAVAGTWRNTGD